MCSCSTKLVFLKILQNSQQKTCAGVSFSIHLLTFSLQLYLTTDSWTGFFFKFCKTFNNTIWTITKHLKPKPPTPFFWPTPNVYGPMPPTPFFGPTPLTPKFDPHYPRHPHYLADSIIQFSKLPSNLPVYFW